MMNINKETLNLLGKSKRVLNTLLQVVGNLISLTRPFFQSNVNTSLSLIPVKIVRKKG